MESAAREAETMSSCTENLERSGQPKGHEYEYKLINNVILESFVLDGEPSEVKMP